MSRVLSSRRRPDTTRLNVTAIPCEFTGNYENRHAGWYFFFFDLPELSDAPHWVHHDEHERVTQLLTDFFVPALPARN